MDNIFVSTSNVSTLHNKPLLFHKQVSWQAHVRALMGPICTNRNCSSKEKSMLIAYFKNMGLDGWEKSPHLLKSFLLLADWMHCTALWCHGWSVLPLLHFLSHDDLPPRLISVAPFNCLAGKNLDPFKVLPKYFNFMYRLQIDQNWYKSQPILDIHKGNMMYTKYI